ncbi:MAG: hypothetical protein NTV52_35885 [Acidobacteria bacterium]|nr:hypothetical protein [Acidobacteriota bacterium]
MRHILRLRSAAAVFAVFAVTPLTAGTLTYSTNSSWVADTTSVLTLNFANVAAGYTTGPSSSGLVVNSAIAIGSVAYYNNLNGYVTSDFQIIGSIGASNILGQANANASQSYWNWGTQAIVFSPTSTGPNSISMRVNFRSGGVPTNVSAFAVNLGLGGGTGSSGTIAVTPQGMSAQTVTTLNQPGLTFFGVSSDTQTFSYFDITITDPSPSGRYIVLDNLSRGTSTITSAPPPPPPPTETPDAATLLTVGTGLAYLGYLRRNRQLDMA